MKTDKRIGARDYPFIRLSATYPLATGLTMVTREIDIGAVIRDARLFDLKRRKVLDDEITRVVNDLFDLLERRKIDYVVVGGIALLFYIQGRNTRDIDLILAVSDLKNLPELKITQQDRDFARADFRGLQIDVLLTQNRLFDFVSRQHTALDKFQKRPITLATPQGLALLKLFALPSLYRQGIFDRVALYETDLTMLMQEYSLDAAKLLAVLKDYLSESDIESLTEILTDIEKRIRRFKQRKRST